MSRILTTLLGLYLGLAVSTRLAERAGMMRCSCNERCWCKKPVLSTFRFVMPLGHRGA